MGTMAQIAGRDLPLFLTKPRYVQHTCEYSELNGGEQRRTALSSEAAEWWQ